MPSPTRFSTTLGRRSIVARVAAVLALAACGVAIYLLVMSFTESDGSGEPKNEKKERSEQTKGEKAAAASLPGFEAPGAGLLASR